MASKTTGKRRTNTKRPAGRGTSPLVSIIIPVYNRSRLIKECLDSLFAQKVSFPFEIVLIDDKSTDDTVSVLREWQARYPGKIQVGLQERNQGQWKARNHGLRIAKGKFIVFTDSDCVAQKGWLDLLTADLRSGKEVATQGYSTGQVKNIWQELIQETYDGFMAGMVRDGYAQGFDTRNAAVAMSVLEKVGDFQTRHAEDADLGARIVAAGFKIKYVPKAVIFHYHRTGLMSDVRANYNFATRYPLILHRNHHLLKAQASLVRRVLFGLGIIVWSFALPFVTYLTLIGERQWFLYWTIGAVLLVGLVSLKAIRSPMRLFFHRVLYYMAQSIGTCVGFIEGLPRGMRRDES